MAKNNNLGDFLAGIANKIRGLLGTTDPINPQDFEDKIQGVYDKGFSEGGPSGITATDADVLAGKVFGSGGNAKSTGTMPDRGQYQYGHFGSGTNYVAINALPEGYYHSDGQSWAPEARISNSDMASGIGLTAAKIMKGNTILGVAGSGVSTPAQIGVKPFLKTDFDFYVADKGEISAGKAPCNGNLRLWFTLLSGGYTEGVEYLKSGTRKVSGKTWNFGDSHYYIDIATKKGEAISFKFKSYGNNSKGYLYFLYYTSVS